MFFEIFNGDGEISFLVVELNLEEDLVILLFFFGLFGLLKGVMIMYYNLIVLGFIVKFEGMLNFNENFKILILIFFYCVFGMIVVLLMSF